MKLTKLQKLFPGKPLLPLTPPFLKFHCSHLQLSQLNPLHQQCPSSYEKWV